MTDADEFKDWVNLNELLSFQGFSFSRYYRDEVTVLQPQLEELGYSEIRWYPGESDSFGPLTRTVMMVDSQGRWVQGVYG